MSEWFGGRKKRERKEDRLFSGATDRSLWWNGTGLVPWKERLFLLMEQTRRLLPRVQLTLLSCDTASACVFMESLLPRFHGEYVSKQRCQAWFDWWSPNPDDTCCQWRRLKHNRECQNLRMSEKKTRWREVGMWVNCAGVSNVLYATLGCRWVKP